MSKFTNIRNIERKAILANLVVKCLEDGCRLALELTQRSDFNAIITFWNDEANSIRSISYPIQTVKGRDNFVLWQVEERTILYGRARERIMAMDSDVNFRNSLAFDIGRLEAGGPRNSGWP